LKNINLCIRSGQNGQVVLPSSMEISSLFVTDVDVLYARSILALNNQAMGLYLDEPLQDEYDAML
jgi:hypothetical protein